MIRRLYLIEDAAELVIDTREVMRGSLKLDIVIQILTHTWWELLLMKSALFESERICEICHSIARNIVGPNDIEMIEQLNNEATSASATAAVSAPGPSTETRSFWHGHRFLNFLLACMVFAFVISWLFHFNVPS
ncbi:hypothetical protein M0R45_029044 [Rubus argutus]|uniref:Uncharacterized protein n=1 Tax=Rubus argutus TaxID=59490 RepID=A0AAW1WAH7_RUBAR